MSQCYKWQLDTLRKLQLDFEANYIEAYGKKNVWQNTKGNKKEKEQRWWHALKWLQEGRYEEKSEKLNLEDLDFEQLRKSMTSSHCTLKRNFCETQN